MKEKEPIRTEPSEKALRDLANFFLKTSVPRLIKKNREQLKNNGSQKRA
ncbi:hypothetical protein [Alkalicoccobacillus gibsonii]|nr:hypothetical protein [Alkalicoccobacillus gibsonii]MBM0064971.1 hypothetical protein [Alkalicoccobacillus gibsonii]